MAQFFKIKIIITDKNTGKVVYDNIRFLLGNVDIEHFRVSPNFEWSDKETVYVLNNSHLKVPSITEAVLTSTHYDYTQATLAKENAIAEIKGIFLKYGVSMTMGWEWNLSADHAPFTSVTTSSVIIDIQLWKVESK